MTRRAFSFCFWLPSASLLAMAVACTGPTTPDRAAVEATVQAQVSATMAAVPTATSVPPTPVPTAVATPTLVPSLSDSDIAARGRAWLTHIERGSLVGSGIVVGTDGYLLTNEHVVRDSGPIRVLLSDGRMLYGDLVGLDPVVDLALIHIAADGLDAARFGDATHLQAGDPVIVVGYALNLPGEPTITRGVFSGHRTVPETRVNYLQTDAAMNPGVSGGGMLDRTGAVVGINVSGIVRSANGTPVQGINFAIPAELAQTFVQSARAGQGSIASTAPVPTPFVSGPDTVVVSKRFGAALRASPSSDATVIASIGCGEPLLKLQDGAGGWVRVRWGATEGWVGGVRLDSGSQVRPGACSGAPYPPYHLGDVVLAMVESGCLSVRPDPSGNAPVSVCVPSGHAFRLTNGPIEVAGEDWYGVRSLSTGQSGWTRAAYLVR